MVDIHIILCFWFGMIIYTEEVYSKVKERIPGKFKTIITSFIGIIFCIVFRMISKNRYGWSIGSYIYFLRFAIIKRDKGK